MLGLAITQVLVDSCGMDTKTLIGLLIRHGLSIAGTYAAGTGYMTADEVQTAGGALVAIAAIVWSVAQKVKAKKAQG